MAVLFKGINPVYFWCFMLLVGRVLGEVPPPTIKEGRHVSLNAVRVEWDVTVSSGNGSDDITSFTVGLSTDNCTHFAQRKDVSDIKFKTWTFYDVDTEARAACVKTVTSNGTSSWASISIRNEENRPPSIVQGPDAQKIYYFATQDMETKTLTCIVKGKPKPTVTWTVNGKLIKSGSNGYSVLPNDSLSIESVGVHHQGAYRCIASNAYGKAQSDIVSIQEAVLMRFPFEEPRDYPIRSGRSLVLPCRQRPHSVPEGSIAWLKATDRGYYTDVTPDHKRAIGPGGELLFVYVVSSDAGVYKCEVWNHQLNQGVDGSESKVIVDEGDAFDAIKPALLEKSSESVLSLEGEKARITCVFSGRPAPDIIWKRVGGRLDDRHKTVDYNRTLEIDPVRRSDAGTYECEGSNVASNGVRDTSQPVKFKLIVYARPKWVLKPHSVNATVGDDVTFQCRADGIPKPIVQWYINGELFQGQETSKYLSEGEDLVIRDVQKDNMLNVQCNASNSNGYLYADAYLNVVFPTMIVRPPQNVTLKPGGVVTFECGIESDPGTPVAVTWFRGDKPIIIEEGRIYVTSNHTLVINTTNEEDGGASFVTTYTCVVTNSVHEVRAKAKLRPSGSPEIGIKIQASSREYGERKELSLIGLCAALVSMVVICIVLFFIYRRRQQALMKRSGTETSNLTYLSSNSHQEDETTRLPCDDSELPLLPYLDDDILKNKIKEVLIVRNRIDLGRTLGKGQFGRVYEGVLRDSRGKLTARVAVKTLKFKPEETEIVELFLREAVMMKDFWHAHVLSLIGISVDDDGSPMVILPLMENSDLRIYVQDPEKEITVLELLKLGHQVAQGMIYLSNMRFIHRDLAARNCMVDVNRVVKVADFGLSRDLFSRDYYRIEDGKTPLPVRWMAPESLSKSIFTTLSDVWSYGVLLWELMTRGAVPYPDVDNWDIAHYIQSGKRLAQPVYCPDSIYSIMLSCWEEEPENRPTFERIVKDIDVIIDSAKTLPKASSHLYLNIHSTATVSDYRDVTHTTV